MSQGGHSIIEIFEILEILEILETLDFFFSYLKTYL